MPKALLIECNGLAWASYSMQALSTSDGKGVGAIFGTIRSIRSLIDRFDPDVVFTSFDVGKSKRRRELFPAYKAHRSDTSGMTEEEIAEAKAYRDEFHRQANIIPEFLAALGVPVLRVPDIESDDTIATLCHVFKQDYTVVIASNDKDFLQLVDTNVSVYNHVQHRHVDHKNFTEMSKEVEKKAKGEIPLESWLLYRAIVGDSSDNIPGIEGVGPAKGRVFVEGCSTVDELIEKMVEQQNQKKSKVVERIIAGKESIELFHKLMDLKTIHTVPEVADGVFEQLGSISCKYDEKKLFKMCKEYEFDSICKEIGSWPSPFRRLHRRKNK